MHLCFPGGEEVVFRWVSAMWNVYETEWGPEFWIRLRAEGGVPWAEGTSRLDVEAATCPGTPFSLTPGTELGPFPSFDERLGENMTNIYWGEHGPVEDLVVVLHELRGEELDISVRAKVPGGRWVPAVTLSGRTTLSRTDERRSFD